MLCFSNAHSLRFRPKKHSGYIFKWKATNHWSGSKFTLHNMETEKLQYSCALEKCLPEAKVQPAYILQWALPKRWHSLPDWGTIYFWLPNMQCPYSDIFTGSQLQLTIARSLLTSTFFFFFFFNDEKLNMVLEAGEFLPKLAAAS